MWLAAASGIFGINYEVLFYRLITARFGDLIHVHAAIMATFLFGIALGARFAHRFRGWLWAFEILVGIFAVVILALLGALEESPLLAKIGGSALATALVSGALVSVPAFLVGMSIPLFSDAVRRIRSAHDPSSFAPVYALYNLGAAASVLLVEFYWIRTFGHQATLWTLAAGNFGIGAILYFGFPGLRQLSSASDPRQASSPPEPTWSDRVGLVWIGVLSSVFQMFFLRVSIELFGSSRDLFALNLAVVLLGYPLGVWMRRQLDLARALCWTALSASILLFLFVPAQSFWLSNQGSLGQLSLFPPLLSLTGWKLTLLFFLGGVPFTCLGAVLPAYLAEADDAEHVGDAMFCNGLGNGLGFLVYSFAVRVLFDEVGQALVLTGALLVGARWIALEGLRRRRLSLALALVGFALGASFLEPRDFFQRHAPEGYRYDPKLEGPRTFHFEVVRTAGDDAGIRKSKDEDGTLQNSLFYLGLTSVTASIGDRVTTPEVLSGLLPAVFAPKRDRGLVFGIGTGMTAGTAALLFEETDAIEINRSVLELLPQFSEANFNLATNPRVTLHHDDARTFLLAPGEPYDVILNSVSVPTFASAAKIYTEEFFQRVKSRLTPDGVFLTWIGLGTNDRCIRSILGALSKVFQRAAAVYLDTGYYMLVCSDQPIRRHSLESLDLPEVLKNAVTHGFAPGTKLDQALGSLILTENIFESFPTRGLVNTDDFPIIEFSVWDPTIPRTGLMLWLRENPDFLRRDVLTGVPLPPEESLRRALAYQDPSLQALAAQNLKFSADLLVRTLWDRPAPGPEASQKERELYLTQTLGLFGWLQKERRLNSEEIELLRRTWLELAEISPTTGDFARQAALSLRGVEGREDEALRLFYRSIILDPKYRVFVAPSRGGETKP